MTTALYQTARELADNTMRRFNACSGWGRFGYAVAAVPQLCEAVRQEVDRADFAEALLKQALCERDAFEVFCKETLTRYFYAAQRAADLEKTSKQNELGALAIRCLEEWDKKNIGHLEHRVLPRFEQESVDQWCIVYPGDGIVLTGGFSFETERQDSIIKAVQTAESQFAALECERAEVLCKLNFRSECHDS